MKRALIIFLVACSPTPESELPDAAVTTRCASMTMTGQSCDHPGEMCEWAEGIDAGAPPPQFHCTCRSAGTWQCEEVQP